MAAERAAMTVQLNEKLKEQVMELCRDIAGSRRIAAACIYGPWVCGYADEKTDVNVLLILGQFTLRANTYFESVDGVNVSILTVNRLDFERDVRAGWLGEFFSEKVTGPYEPLTDGAYLRFNEVKTKKRTIRELLGNLILEFPESSHEFLIEKEYFMYEYMMRQARLVPSLTLSLIHISEPTRPY